MGMPALDRWDFVRKSAQNIVYKPKLVQKSEKIYRKRQKKYAK